jgi:hypothetical protein
MNPFSRMRDPRESRRWGYEAARAATLDIRDELRRFAELTRLAHEVPDRVKVFCLTRDDLSDRDEESAIFGRGFAHPRLWEHYADTHCGVCLCFDRRQLTTQLTRRLARFGPLEHGPVQYVDRAIAPDALRFLIEESNHMPLTDALHKHFDTHVRELFFTKLRDWETEAEYRFVVRTDNTEPVDVNIAGSLRAVIIGEAVRPQYLPSLSALCDSKRVSIHRIQWPHGRPYFTDPRARGYTTW